MNKSESIYLTPSQFTLNLIASMIGVGVMYLPNNVIKDGRQDGWIACIVGGIYPVYMAIIAAYICKRFPGDDILTLSKRYFGICFGNIFNIIFTSYFLFLATSVLSGFSNLFRVYAASFLKSYQILLPTLIPVAFIVYKGLKAMGRLSQVILFLGIILIFIPVGSLVYGSILNVMPVFQAGILNILKASKETAFFYGGFEIIFLIYPFLQDKKKIFKCGIESIVFTITIYSWTAFLSIYYLGIDISPKYLWPVLALTDSVRIPIINSFRYAFISLWSIVALKCVSMYYFAAAYSLNGIIKKVSLQKFVVILYPIIIYLAILYGNTTTRRYYSGKLIEIYVIFNLIYVSLIAIIIHYKRGDTDEKS